MTHSYEESLESSREYFGNDLSARAFVDKYALRNKENELLECAPKDMHRRIAKEIARVEKKKFKNPLSYKEILTYLEDFKRIIPQGSPAYGIGNRHQYVSISNCFVLHEPDDSYAGIMYTDQQLVQISKRRGGNGISLNKLRPADAPTNNSSRTSTGVVSWMRRYSHSNREVGQSGRRGALMLSLNVKHPQIVDFITSKNDEVSVTGANISAQYTDEFLEAVQKNKNFTLQWPIDSKTPEITSQVKAKDIWKITVHNAWNRAEPGVLFWDNILRESPADCYADVGFRTVSTNPCGELPLSVLDSCRLLVINLFNYVVDPYTTKAKFDFDSFRADAMIAQRFMDDIVDLELESIDRIIKKIKSDPEPEFVKASELDTWVRIRAACENGRRTGTGITALGDTLAALNIKYGSIKSINVTEHIYKTLKLAAYRSSVDMAMELGPFPVWDFAKEKKNPFLLRIKDEDPQLYSDMKKYGRRNIALLTTAPTGTTSMMASLAEKHHGTTGGIEPLFMESYTRRKKGNPGDADFRSDFVDELGDHWMEFTVYHPGIKLWMEATGETDTTKSPYHGACSPDIDWVNRVKMQAAAQKHVDHSISSTVNLPNDVTEEEVDKIFLTAWKSGCKGITVYRQGCRTGVMIAKERGIKKVNAVKRGKELECDVHHISVQGQPYFVLVGLHDGDPYEVFAGKNGFIGKKVKKGVIIKKGRKQYKAVFDDEAELSPIAAFTTSDEEVITRLISTSLRHGTDIAFLIHQLEKTQGDLQCFSKSIVRALKKYVKDGTKVYGEDCPECGQALSRQEGCVSCLSCGWGRC